MGQHVVTLSLALIESIHVTFIIRDAQAKETHIVVVFRWAY